jgi:hypothetical protein
MSAITNDVPAAKGSRERRRLEMVTNFLPDTEVAKTLSPGPGSGSDGMFRNVSI